MDQFKLAMKLLDQHSEPLTWEERQFLVTLLQLPAAAAPDAAKEGEEK